MITPNFTAADVRAYRDMYGCSLMEARGYFVKKQLLDVISEVRITGDIQTLVDVVEELVHRERF